MFQTSCSHNIHINRLELEHFPGTHGNIAMYTSFPAYTASLRSENFTEGAESLSCRVAGPRSQSPLVIHQYIPLTDRAQIAVAHLIRSEQISTHVFHTPCPGHAVVRVQAHISLGLAVQTGYVQMFIRSKSSRR